MVRAVPLPKDALLSRYADRAECYTDCYTSAAPVETDLAGFLLAFYTSPLFRVERMILRLAGYPSRDTEIAGLLDPDGQFAAWRVEAVTTDQVLLCDVSARTRSWLHVTPERLYFGSAVVPAKEGTGLGWLFTALLGYHRLYSRALLWAAVRRLSK